LRRNRFRIWSCFELGDDADSLWIFFPFCCCAAGFWAGLFGAVFFATLDMFISVTFAPADPALSLRKARVASGHDREAIEASFTQHARSVGGGSRVQCEQSSGEDWDARAIV
jgi:hypothetical protein